MGFFMTQIRGDSLINYYKPEKASNSNNLQKIRDSGIEVETYKGQITKRAKKEIQKTLFNWAWAYEIGSQKKSIEYKSNLYFLTLTLPSQQWHDDWEITQTCLNTFITGIKYRYALKNFLWKAEKQNNSNLHYHFVIDKRIDAAEVRKFWNDCINKLDYVSNYRMDRRYFFRNGFRVDEKLLSKYDEQKQRQWYEYGKATFWSNPRTIDVVECDNARKIGVYLSKYVSKSDGEQMINGRVWSRSRELAKIGYFSKEFTDLERKEFDSILQLTSNEIVINEFVQILDIPGVMDEVLKLPYLGRKVKFHYNLLYNKLIAS